MAASTAPPAGITWLDGVGIGGLDSDSLADLRNRKLGFVFQGFNLLARTSAMENVELPLLYAHRGLTRRQKHDRALQALTLVGLADRAAITPTSFPAASSSAWPSPAPW